MSTEPRCRGTTRAGKARSHAAPEKGPREPNATNPMTHARPRATPPARATGSELTAALERAAFETRTALARRLLDVGNYEGALEVLHPVVHAIARADAHARLRAEKEALGLVRATPWQSRPRCGARTRGGAPCRAPAMWDDVTDAPVNGRCRHHGGCSTGPRTAEGRARAAEATRARSAARRQGHAPKETG